MSLNPISKIIYRTPNQSPEAGLSELFDILGNKVQAKWWQDRIELITDSDTAKLQIEFKNGKIREIDIHFLRNIKHSVERILLSQEEANQDDFDALSIYTV